MQYVDDQTSLIQGLFSASTGAGGGAWLPFLELLRRVTRADGATIFLDRGREEAEVWTDGISCADAAANRSALRFDRVYDQEGLPAGVIPEGFVRLVKVRAGGATATLCIKRLDIRKDFRSTDRQYLTALTPFLGQAVETWSGLERQRAMTALTGGLASGLGAAWVIMDLTGIVQEMSANAGDLRLLAGQTVRRRLEFPDGDLALTFRTGFAACIAAPEVPQALFDPETGTDLVLRRTHLAGDLVVVATFRAPAELPDPDHFAAHFGLSRSESRLAALICEGHSIKTAAADLGWTEETARTCSKAIFTRLGVQGQTGLLRRVLTSAVTLG
ncbi:hypothetical protein HJ526_10945 [Donghicola sp. C2-DW-16]|uniref:HTH luxR-type domain-containing protein n=1 Tax=Donghicola mangrovi TaxID=2729614 RepID=A0ABX2PEQ2_9RHOB|nr:hypothetical protein [Donghicola mangrovi]NVO27939.1 hypothetical protein [Donghicola mangrovi]